MSAASDVLEFIQGVLGGAFWWLTPSGRKEKSADQTVNRYVPEEHQPLNEERAVEEDVKLIESKRERKIVRDVVNIVLKGKRLTNHNEAIIKLYVKNYFHLDFWVFSRITGLERGLDVKGFIKGYRKAAEMIDLDKKHLGGFLSRYNKRVKKIRKLVKKGKDKKTKKRIKKLINKIREDWQDVIKELITQSEVELGIYDKQLADLLELKDELDKMKAGELKDDAKGLIENKKEAKEWIDKEKEVLEEFKNRVSDKVELEGLQKIADACFEKHSQAILSETRATSHGLSLMKAFLDVGWFKQRITRTSKYLTKEHLAFYKDYNKYVLDLAQNLSHRINEVKSEEEELSKPKRIESGVQKLKTCLNCSSQINSEFRVCPYCGEKQSETPSVLVSYMERKEDEPQWTIICPRCKHRFRTRQEFSICPMCGKSIK